MPYGPCLDWRFLVAKVIFRERLNDLKLTDILMTIYTKRCHFESQFCSDCKILNNGYATYARFELPAFNALGEAIVQGRLDNALRAKLNMLLLK